MNRASEFRMRLDGLGRHHEIGAVARAAQRNFAANAAARAGYENGFSFQRHLFLPSNFKAYSFTAKDAKDAKEKQKKGNQILDIKASPQKKSLTNSLASFASFASFAVKDLLALDFLILLAFFAFCGQRFTCL